MSSFSIQYKNSIISYHRSGAGPRKLVCFHGYGEEAGAFDFLEKYIGDQYTIYSIALPFHGKTDWQEGFDFSSTDLVQIVEYIITPGNGKPPLRHAQEQNEKLSLLGFSLGGRIALGYYQVQPGKVEKLVLLAPDGLKVNFWYWLSTQTWLGNKFFAFTMKRPRWFFGFLKLLNKLKWVNPSIFKFVNFYIGNSEVRRLLYSRWTTLRKIKPDLTTIKKTIRNKATPFRLVYGQHDKIILSSVGEKFRKGIEAYCTVAVIASGHQVLHEKHAEEIVRSLMV